MLSQLYIKNFILVNEIVIDFSTEFNAITGETGAGKSVLLGALSLVTGGRADNSLFLKKDKKCIIEASFNVSKLELQLFFDENNIEYDENCVLRREINPNGTSRCFINDSLVNVKGLKEIGEHLVDIHSQKDTQLLRTKSYSFLLLDTFSETTDLFEEYRKTYFEYTKSLKRKEELLKVIESILREKEFVEHQLKEYEKITFDAKEFEEYEKELTSFQNSEKILLAISEVMRLLDGENGILHALKTSETKLSQNYIPQKLESITERINSTQIELADIFQSLEEIQEMFYFSSDAISKIQEKVDTVFALQTKFRTSSFEELLKQKNILLKKLEGISKTIHENEIIEKTIQKQTKRLNELAREISKKRVVGAPIVSKKITENVQQLNMREAEIQYNIEDTKTFSSYGKNTVELLAKTNRGGEHKPLSKIASGGELSRIMLVIKKVLASKKTLPTIIFDEIDSGVSGEAAKKIATMLSEMAETLQIVIITHTPQIAAKAKAHFLIEKTSGENEKTHTELSLLEGEERVAEISKMITGTKDSPTGRKTAHELMN